MATTRQKRSSEEWRRRVSDERILTAAIEEFNERGFVGASLVGVAQRAATTRPTLYANFGSKDDLHVAAVTWAMEHLVGTLLSIYDDVEGEPIANQVQRAVEVTFAFAEDHSAQYRFLRSADPGVPVESRARVARGEEAVESRIAELVVAGLGRMNVESPKAARLIARGIARTVDAAAQDAAQDPTVDGAAAASLTSSMILASLAGIDLELVRTI